MDCRQVKVDLPSIVGPMTSMFLKMIHDTHKFKEVDAVTKEPEFLVVVLGPTMKLDSSNRESMSPEDNQMFDTVASQISEMTKEGIYIEIFLFAVRLMGVDSATMLPDFIKIENGAVSLIGYQAPGFPLTSIYEGGNSFESRSVSRPHRLSKLVIYRLYPILP